MSVQRLFVPLALALAVIASACATPSAAATAGDGELQPSSPGVVILVRSERHLKVALRSLHELVGERPREAHVIACGDAVESLRAAGPLAATLADSAGQGIRVVACGLSLERKNIAATELAAGVEVVPNGIIEAVQLQERGLLSVEL